MRAHSKVFHMQCFRCDACARALQPGEQFALRDDSLLCKADYQQRVTDLNLLSSSTAPSPHSATSIPSPASTFALAPSQLPSSILESGGAAAAGGAANGITGGRGRGGGGIVGIAAMGSAPSAIATACALAPSPIASDLKSLTPLATSMRATTPMSTMATVPYGSLVQGLMSSETFLSHELNSSQCSSVSPNSNSNSSSSGMCARVCFYCDLNLLYFNICFSETNKIFF